MIMKGYWNRPEITAQAVRGGWCHSGDIGTMDEHGYLYVLDRLKDMIKPGGENVYSPEVESVIGRASGGARSGRDRRARREVGRGDQGGRGAALRRGARGRRTDRMVPRAYDALQVPESVDFVDALPKGGTGKLLKHVLQKRYSLKTVPAG